MDVPPLELKIPESEWNFKEIPPKQRPYCVTWEMFRLVSETPTSNEAIARAVDSIVVTGSNSEWFQRFVRSCEFKPIAVMGWIRSRGIWPDAPWNEVSSTILCELEQYKRMPVFVPSDGPDQSRMGTAEATIRAADSLSAALVYRARDVERKTHLTIGDQASNASFRTLVACGALLTPDFRINSHQYTKKEIKREFSRWLDAHTDSKVEKFNSQGGRIDPYAWLKMLAAYRLHSRIGDNTELCRLYGERYRLNYRSDKSLRRYAKDFYAKILSQFLPSGLLPPAPEESISESNGSKVSV